MANISGDGTDEVLRGVAGEENSIAGNDGNDKIIGRGKSDLLLGGKGDDTVFGANGHDEMYGGAGNDYLKGGNGRDSLSGDKGNNTLNGGNGDDTFVINAALVGQSFSLIEDFDIERQLRRMTFDDALQIKNVGGQQFVLQETSDGDVELYVDGVLMATIQGSVCGGLSASDLLNATDFVGGSPASVTLLDEFGAEIQHKIVGTPEDDALSGVPGISNLIVGQSGDDILNGRGKGDELLGNQGQDTLNGSSGSDTLKGGGGADELSGGNGGDDLFGDKGNDTLDGGRGSDELTGGANADTFQFNVAHAGTGVDTITDYDAAEGDVIALLNVTGSVTTAQNGADAEIYHDGELLFVVLDTAEGDLIF